MVVCPGEELVLSSMWGGEDHWLSPLSTNPSQGLMDVKDQMMGGSRRLVLFRVSPGFEFLSRFHSRFAPGFTPNSKSNSIAIPVLRSKNAGSTEGYLSPSHSIIIHRPFLGGTSKLTGFRFDSSRAHQTALRV